MHFIRLDRLKPDGCTFRLHYSTPGEGDVASCLADAIRSGVITGVKDGERFLAVQDDPDRDGGGPGWVIVARVKPPEPVAPVITVQFEVGVPRITCARLGK